jgi:peptidoglycan/LPS O-acetylase OafA/YrhL
MLGGQEQEPQVTAAPSAKPAGKLNGVDALRGLAAILVVTLHTTHTLAGPKDFGHEPFHGLFGFGRAGVDFFFVLSGFIITYVHFGDIGRPGTFGSFWYKRLLRIYPTYWAVTALFCLLLFISPSPDRLEQVPSHIVASFLLYQERLEPILGVGWSLRHELLFYGLFGLLLLSRRVGLLVLALWGLGIILNGGAQLIDGTPFFAGTIYGRIVFRVFNGQFFFGIATAYVVRRGLWWHPGALAAIGAAGFLSIGMWESFGTAPMFEWPLRTLGYATCSSLILYGIATLDKAGRTRVPALALRFGAASYSIYLTHLPTVLVLEYGLRFVTRLVPMPVEAGFVLVVGGAVVAGTLFSEWVEQPILRWGRGRTASAASRRVVTPG